VTFQERAAENLSYFGWTIEPSQIPENETCIAAIRSLQEWWNPLDERTKNIVGTLDLADALWNAGELSKWPDLYYLISGNNFGTFKDTMNDVIAALERAANSP